jgi:hypothetical protein
MFHTKHFKCRQKSRALDAEIENLILQYGEWKHKQGAIFVRILDREATGQIDELLLKRARGWVILLSHDSEELITCYREHNASPKRSGGMKHPPDDEEYDFENDAA